MKKCRTILFSAVMTFALAASVSADVTTIPPGVNPGDTYRLVFVTDGTTDATSYDIATYNAWGTSQATNVAELAALSNTWAVIASSTNVQARNNISAVPGVDEPSAGIFLLDGTKIADSYTDLWDGFIAAPININQNGSAVGAPVQVWTGTQSSGFGTSKRLGTATPSRGHKDFDNGAWMNAGTSTNITLNRMYVISGMLTVPDTALPVRVVDLAFSGITDVLPARGLTVSNATELTYGWDGTNVLFNGSADECQNIYGGFSLKGSAAAINQFRVRNNNSYVQIASATSGSYADSRLLLMWDDDDFLFNGTKWDSSSDSVLSYTLSQNLQNAGQERGGRFVIRDGDTYYVSKQIYGLEQVKNTNITYTVTGDTVGLEWGAFNPDNFASVNTAQENLGQGVTFSAMNFTNVTGVGLLLQSRRWQGCFVQLDDFTADLFGPPPAPELTVDRPVTTPNDRLRVNYKLPRLDGGATVTLAVLDSGSSKLEFTAYDDRSANAVEDIYTTKNVFPTEIADAADDFTVSGFFSSLTNITTAIPINDDLNAQNVIDVTSLTNPPSVYKDGTEQAVYIDLTSISGISSGTNTLTIELSASSYDGSPLTISTNVTIVPDGGVTFSKVSSEVTDTNAFEASQSILLGSSAGDTGNRFTGGATLRHPLEGPTFNQDQTLTVNGDHAYGMYFDTDTTGEFTLTDILIGMHNNGTDEVPFGPSDTLLKLEIWKINAPLSGLSLTDTSRTFPLEDRELVFTGTGTIDPSTIANNDIWKMDLPDMKLDADTRYGFLLRLNETSPAIIYPNVDWNSFALGNHLRLNNNSDAFPFYGTVTGQFAGNNWPLVFFLNGYGVGYAGWAGLNGVGGMDEDPDLDGLNNLGEYALNGDPKDDTDKGKTEVVVSGGTFKYIHVQLIDTTEVDYLVEVNDADDLTVGGWTTAGISTSSGSYDGQYNSVTNSVTDGSQGFMRMTISEK
jgi:hypothetical protein